MNFKMIQLISYIRKVVTNMKKAYLFRYIFDYKSTKTEYIWVIAVSHKQALYFFNEYIHKNLGRVYDRADEACNEKSKFLRCHEIGEVLGEFAII